MKRALMLSLVLLACVPRSDRPESRDRALPPRAAATAEAQPIVPKDDVPVVTPRVERARAMVERFKGKLQSALRQAIKEDGPVAAISVCNDAAPGMSEVLRDGELRLRRVGTRPRNVERNSPSARERELMTQMSLLDKEYAYDDGEHFLYMQGIFIDRGLCVMCHGTPEHIPPGVQAALNERYPNDTAVGYTRGELRGAFVVYGRGAPAE